MSSRARFWAARVAVATYVAAALVLLGASESRAAPAFVSTTADSGPGSLRQAILDVNAGLFDAIEFRILPAATAYVIQVGPEPLPSIQRPVTIDATTQPGYAGRPIVELRGPVVIGSDPELPLLPGLEFFDGSAGSAVLGLSLTHFTTAVSLDSDGTTLRGNWIGIGVDGSDGPNETGVRVFGDANTIGPGNVVSYNLDNGVEIFGSDNVVIGNIIGLNPTGTSGAGNGTGVAVGEGAARNRIGGTTAGERNVISDNVFEGILGEFSDATVILGNYIGTDAAGTAGIGNTTGIRLNDSPATIGGTTAGAGNVISGNIGLDTGISVDDSSGTVIQGNFIGTDVTGTQILGNDGGGISLDSGSNYLIANNLISGNGSFGGDGEVIFFPDPGIDAFGVTDVTIQGNRIGTTAAGDGALPNSAGIQLGQTERVLIGGTAAGQGNLISGNLIGVELTCDGVTPPLATTIQGNLIGANAAGTAALANENDGIDVFCGIGTLVGGTVPGAGNTISGNLGNGIFDAGTNEVIQGNRIGVDVNGNALGNGGSGVFVGSSFPEIGGDVPAAGNIIAFNQGDGVTIQVGVGNPVRLNSIHDNLQFGIDLNADDILNGNDPGDGDGGANLTQNYPVLTSARATNGLATITGVLDAQPGLYVVDLYGNTPGDVEGESYIGSVNVPVGATPASFTATVPIVTAQRIITATATEAFLLNTSEFSPPIVALLAPTLTTQASPSVPVGGQILDTATLGGDFEVTGSLVFRLFGPNDPNCAGTPVVFNVPLTGDQFVYQSPPFTTTAAGTYRWVAEYVVAGTTVMATPCDDPAEVVVVTPAAPAIATQASPSVPLGGTVSDTATLTGAFNPTGTITFRLYGPGDTACTGVPVFTSVRSVVTGGATSEPFTPTAPGTYRWIASYSGDANNLPATGACAEPTEAVVVTPAPTTTTSTSTTTTTVPPTTTTSSTTTTSTSTTTTSTTTTVPPTTTTSSTTTSTSTSTTSTSTSTTPSTSTTSTTRPTTTSSSTTSTTRPITTSTSTTTTTRPTTTTSSTTTSTTSPPPITTTTSTTTTLPPTTTTSSTTTTSTTTTTLPPTTTTSSTTTTTTTTPPVPPPGTTVPTTAPAPVPTTAPAAIPTTAPPLPSTTAPATTVQPTTVPPTTAAPTTVPPTSTTAPTTTVPPPPPGASLDALNPDGQRSGPPGVGLDVSGGGYVGCSTVYFFFDGVRIGSDTPDLRGNVGAGNLSVPGDADPGQHLVTSACSASGGPVRASSTFVVTDATVHRSAFATSLAQPSQVSLELGRLADSAGIAALIILLFAFPSKLFNATVEENYDEIRGWFHLPARVADTASTLGRTVGFVVLSVLTAMVLGFLSPDFGPDLNGLVLVVGFAVSLMVMSAGFSLPADIAVRRQTGRWGKLNFLPGTLLVAIVTVALSRVLGFQPGYFYGACAGLAFAGALSAKAQGKMTAANWTWAFAISVAAWFARIPVSAAAAQPDGSVWWIGLEAGLALTFLWGIESLVVAMLPMRFLDGPKVRTWSPVAWGALLFLGIFAVVHVLLQPTAGYVGHTTGEVTIGVLVIFAIFAAISVGTWAYFRYRPKHWATR